MSRHIVETRHLPALAALKLYELTGPEGVALILPRGRFKYYRKQLKEIGLTLPYACLMPRSSAKKEANRSKRDWVAAGSPGRDWQPRPANPAIAEAFAEARERAARKTDDSPRAGTADEAAQDAFAAGAMPPHPQNQEKAA